MKNCKYCGKEFVARHGNKKYCDSPICNNRYLRYKHVIKKHYLKNKRFCVECNKELFYRPGKRRRKYCDRCRIKVHEEHVKKMNDNKKFRNKEFNGLSDKEQLRIMMNFSMDFIKENEKLYI